MGLETVCEEGPCRRSFDVSLELRWEAKGIYVVVLLASSRSPRWKEVSIPLDPSPRHELSRPRFWHEKSVTRDEGSVLLHIYIVLLSTPGSHPAHTHTARRALTPTRTHPQTRTSQFAFTRHACSDHKAWPTMLCPVEPFPVLTSPTLRASHPFLSLWISSITCVAAP